MAAVHDYALDGLDIDWEYPDGAQVAGYNAAVKSLAAALHAEGKEISAAVTRPRARSASRAESGRSQCVLNLRTISSGGSSRPIPAPDSASDSKSASRPAPKQIVPTPAGMRPQGG